MTFVNSSGNRFDFWNQSLLPKHGSRVRRLTIRIHDDDNVAHEDVVHPPSAYPLSFNCLRTLSYILVQARQIFEHCQHVQTVNIEGQSEEALRLPLGRLIQSLGRSPSLRAFSCAQLSSRKDLTVDPHTNDSLGYQLSLSQYLTKLQLFHVLDLDVSWTSYTWSGSVTHLSIQDCGPQMTPQTVHTVIQSIAPHVQHLILASGDWRITKEVRLGYEPLAVLFELPSLIHLRLDIFQVNKSLNLLSNFRACNELVDLVWECDSASELAEFECLLSTHWLHLDHLNVYHRTRLIANHVDHPARTCDLQIIPPVENHPLQTDDLAVMTPFMPSPLGH